MAPSAARAALVTGLLGSLFFVVLNVAMNVYTKWLFSETGGDLPLPWTMLGVQQVQSFMFLYPTLAYMRKRGWDKVTSQGRNGQASEGLDIRPIHMLQVFLVTLLFCVNVGLNSLSLVNISITLNQTVRAFLPVGVLLVSCCIEERTYDWHAYVTTLFVVFGIALTCAGNPDFTWYGFSIVFVSTMMAAVGTSLNGRLLNDGPFGKAGAYGVAQLIYIQAIPAMFIFGFVAYFAEGAAVVNHFQFASGEFRLRAVLNVFFMTFSSFLALWNNLGRCFLVAATNPLTETIAGNAKVAVLCIIDQHLFGTILTGINYAGIGMTFSGFSLHLLLQYASREDDKPGRRDSLDNEQGRLGREDTSGRNFRRPVNRPRMLSAADTGLAAEHLAVELGREPQPQIRRSNETLSNLAAIPEIPRNRSMTWPQPANDERRGMWTGVDFSLVFELPPWLLGSGQAGSPEDYSPLSVASLSPMARRSLGPSLPSGSMSPASTARSRFFSDPTDHANNNQRRLLEDVRLGNHLHAVEEAGEADAGEAEMCEPEPAEPPDLNYL